MNGKWISLVGSKCFFFYKASRRLKPTILGHCILAYIYPAFVNIVELLSISYEKNCYVLLY
jgi:hypothetical protein